MVHVPYKGAGPGIADLVSGHIPIMSPNITGQVLEFHNTVKIRILAVNSPTRLKAAPDIPLQECCAGHAVAKPHSGWWSATSPVLSRARTPCRAQ